MFVVVAVKVAVGRNRSCARCEQVLGLGVAGVAGTGASPIATRAGPSNCGTCRRGRLPRGGGGHEEGVLCGASARVVACTPHPPTIFL